MLQLGRRLQQSRSLRGRIGEHEYEYEHGWRHEHLDLWLMHGNKECVLAACILAGCGVSSTSPVPSGTDDPGGTTSSTTTGATTTPTQPPDACESTEDCGDGNGFCVAPYDVGEGRGPAVCGPECVAENEVQRWCTDHEACCEGLLCREVDGFCEPPDFPTTDSSTGSGTSTGG